jgi:hypothetical protein
MPQPVYSISFIRQKGVHGLSSTVTVPHGFVYVVKFIAAYANSTGGMSVNFRDDTLGATWWHREWGFTDNHSATELVTIAFSESESFNFEVLSVGPGEKADVFAGGYALTLP